MFFGFIGFRGAVEEFRSQRGFSVNPAKRDKKPVCEVECLIKPSFIGLIDIIKPVWLLLDIQMQTAPAVATPAPPNGKWLAIAKQVPASRF